MIANILEELECTAARVPERIAFYDDARQLSYAALQHQAMAIGSFLAKKQCPRSVTAVLMDGRSIDCIPAFLGIIYAGCAYAPLDPTMPTERMELILSRMQPALILTDGKGQKAIEKLNIGQVPVCSFEEAVHYPIHPQRLEDIRFQSSPFDPMSILYTSGSTGLPKGSIQNHMSYIRYDAATIDVYGFDENTVFASQSPFFYANSIIDIYPPIKLGARVYLLPGNALAFPRRFVECMQKNHATELTMTPSSFQGILEALEEGCLMELKWAIMSGERMPSTLLEAWQKAAPNAGFYNFYGSTEAFSVAVGKVQGKYAPGELLPIGKPFRHIHILFLDEDGNEANPRTGGEMLISNPWLSVGYHGDAQRTNESFVIDPMNRGYFERFYRTGDIGRLNEKGELLVLGRRDSQVKHHGYRMELGEVEGALRSIPGWRDGCVLFDKGSGRMYCFFTGELTVKDVQQALRKKLPRYMHPDSFVWLSELPHTATMKIDRVALQKAYMI